MRFTPIIFVVVGAHQAVAHFKIDYPTWRADSLGENASYSQWYFPCKLHFPSLHCIVYPYHHQLIITI